MINLLLFFISSIIGTLGHFLYKLTNNNRLIGFFFAKNESTFEHLKLGITPIFLLSIVEKIKLMNNNILIIKGIQCLVFSSIIIIFFYGKKLLIKNNNALYNILLFYISLFISYVISFILSNMITLPISFKIIGIISIIITIASYFYSSLFKPNFFIFKDPLIQSKD